MKKIILIGSVSLIVVLVGVYFFFFRGNPELDKAIKSLNAQNWEMASAKLKEIIYDNESDNTAKGLLLYAQTRQYCDEKKIKTFDRFVSECYPNMVRIKELLYESKLNELGYLSQKDKDLYMKDSKDLRKQLSNISIPTENMNDVRDILKAICKTGVSKLKLSQGDEIDQALFSFLLAGDSFFGNEDSGVKLIKIAKLNTGAQRLFNLCGKDFVNDLKKESRNDESLIGEYSKYLVIHSQLKNEITEIFKNHPRMQSAYTNVNERNPRLTFWATYLNNSIFFNDDIFDDYLKILEQNNKAGLDVEVSLLDKNNIVSLYFYDPVQQKYFSRFYNFIDNQLSLITFKENGNTRTEFTNAVSPVLFDCCNAKNILQVYSRTIEKKTAIREEQRYNAQKYYNGWGYSGGYEAVRVPYEYELVNADYSNYSLNKDKAEYSSNVNISKNDMEGD